MAISTSAPKDRMRGVPALLYLIYFISFFCGLTQCFEGVFLPELKEYFHLSYLRQMYMVFAKNLPFLSAFAVALLVRRAGYKNSLTIAMLLYAAGTLLLVPALRAERYSIVLFAFFIIGSGFTLHIVAGNPLLSALGPKNTASSRLNLGNALGAVAQIAAPAALTLIIPAAVVAVRAKMAYIETLFLSLGLALVSVAGATTMISDGSASSFRDERAPDKSLGVRDTVWRHPKVVLGFVTIFFVLGVEAALFSFFRNYLEAAEIAGLGPRASQRLFTAYFALFATGRLLASWIQRHIRPKTQLQIHLLSAVVCLAVMIVAKGTVAVAAFLVLGFLVSIFFPTLYSVAMDDIGELAPQASGLLTLGFLGCAVMPLAQGALADSVGLQRSFCLDIVVYLFAAAYVFLVLPARETAGDVA